VTTGPLGTSIGRRAAGGGIWVLGGTVAGGLATTVVMLILAGLLTPAEFGAVAIAVVILEAATIGLSPGLGQAVQSIRQSREVEATALAIALLAGSGVALVLAPLVPALVRLFGVPEAAPLAAAILIALPPRRWNEVRLAQFERQLEFRVPNLVVGLAALMAGAVAVVAAVVGMGAWALLVQVVGTEVLTAVGLTVTGPRPVRPEFHHRAAKDLWRFSRQLLGSSLAVFGYTNVDDVFVARIGGAGALGAYSLAYRIANLAVLVVTRPVQRVLLPVLRRLIEAGNPVSRPYLSSVRALTWMSAALAVTIAVLGPAVLEVVYDGRWVESYWPLRIFSFYALFRALGASSGTVFLAFGSPSLVRRIASIQLIGLLLLIAPATMLLGATGAALAVTVPMAGGVAYAVSRAAKLTRISARSIWWVTLTSWAAALVINGLVALILMLVPGWAGWLIAGTCLALLLALASWRLLFPVLRSLRSPRTV
jgi:lipopolysaccharide exporter